MTLVITLFGRGGIWQLSDFQITAGRKVVDDTRPKQVLIDFPPHDRPSRVALAFTGLAEMPDGTPTLQWIRETLRGETRSPDDTFALLRDRLDRDVAGASWKYRSVPLVLHGGFLGHDGLRCLVQIHNLDRDLRVRNKFELIVNSVEGAAFFATGSGSLSLREKDRVRLTQLMTVRPRTPKDYMRLLATINRRVSKTNQSVSPWCHVAYLPEAQGDGWRSEVFGERGDEHDAIWALDHVLLGIDLTDAMRIFMESFGSWRNSDSEFTVPEAHEEALRRGVEPRK